MRLKATQQGNWVQLGIGAAALLLPPLALGAAFYSMLAEPDEVVTPPPAAQAAAPPPAPALPATVGAEAAFQSSAGQLAEGAPQNRERFPVQGNPVQVATVAAAPAATISRPAGTEAGATPPAAETPPAPAAAPKRTAAHRRRQPEQDPFSPFRAWLQEIGILPRNGKDSRG